MRKKDSLELAHYVDSIEAQQKLYKRSLFVVVMSQIFGGAGLAAGITVGALIARDMLGTASFAGVPAALFTLGSALAAFLVGQDFTAFRSSLWVVTWVHHWWDRGNGCHPCNNN